MSAPMFATLGGDDRDDSQEAVTLNVVDASGKHVDLCGGSSGIGDGAVTTDKLADSAVTDDKIAAGTINADKLAPGVMPTNATAGVAGLVKQAAHVDPSSGSIADVVNALVAAGVMAGA